MFLNPLLRFPRKQGLHPGEDNRKGNQPLKRNVHHFWWCLTQEIPYDREQGAIGDPWGGKRAFAGSLLTDAFADAVYNQADLALES